MLIRKSFQEFVGDLGMGALQVGAKESGGLGLQDLPLEYVGDCGDGAESTGN